MKRFLLFALAELMSFALPAQRLHRNPKAQAIIEHLNALNDYVDNTLCKKDSFMVITNRAINKLFGDKVASYLSEGGDLSLFKNYATQVQLMENCRSI